MRRIRRTRGVWRKGMVAALVLFLLILPTLTTASSTFAFSVLTAGKTDRELFNEGFRHFHNMKWLDAAMWLKAYVLRNPSVLETDPRHAKQVNAALAYSAERVNDAFAAATALARPTQPGIDRKFLTGPTPVPPSLEALPPVTAMPERTVTPTPRTLPPSYPLVCRGGGNRELVYRAAAPGGGQDLRVAFTRAATRAGLNKELISSLKAGECTWLDRTISSGEPGMLRFAEQLVPLTDFEIRWRRGRSASVLPEYLNRMMDPASFVTFRVFNDGAGNFLVTAVE